MERNGGYLAYIFVKYKYFCKFPISMLAQEDRASKICATVHNIGSNRNFSSKLEEESRKITNDEKAIVESCHEMQSSAPLLTSVLTNSSPSFLSTERKRALLKRCPLPTSAEIFYGLV